MASRHKRWSVSYPVQMISEGVYEEGVTLNASSRGLAIETSQLLLPGTHIYVRVVVLELMDSIDFQMCKVHWRKRDRIGLETIGMDQREQQRWESILRRRRVPFVESQVAVPIERVDGVKDLLTLALRLVKEKPALIEILKRVA